MSPDEQHYREESDQLGVRQIPKDAYWGVQTLRAQENFGVSLVRLYNYSTLVHSLAMVKKACTQANQDLGHISTEFANAIIQACDEVIAGELEEQFDVGMLQGGAGTSSNMCVNEVLASRANEILGEPRNTMSPISAL
ncbi:MAG: lyase family protein, partial [Candidatus Thorarchaeota archaeon]